MRYLLLPLFLIFATFASAQELHTFSNGEVADAEKMNKNLSLLLGKIESLEERVTKLEPEIEPDPVVDCSAKQKLLAGTWVVAETGGSLGVGPNEFDTSWWRSDSSTRALRACYFDDQYVFESDGSFQNVLGEATWLEPWQTGTDEQCGVPQAPHDGSSTATYEYQCDAHTITIYGTGSYLGVPKAVNGKELESVDETPDSITYNAYWNDDGSLSATINVGTAWWSYLFVQAP